MVITAPVDYCINDQTFKRLGKLVTCPAQMFKTNFVPYTTDLELPESTFAPARMQMEDLNIGLVKYSNQLMFDDINDYFQILIEKFDLPFSSDNFKHLIFDEFNMKFQGLSAYMKVAENSAVIRSMTHDLSDELRSNSSCGLGLSIKRKELATKFSNSVESYLDNEDFSNPAYHKLFLKDEFRDKTKATRSIAVPQITLWLTGMKYLGGLYRYFHDHPYSTPIAFGLDDRAVTWTRYLNNLGFDPDVETKGFDIKLQDSKMNMSYVLWFEEWLLQHTPQECRMAIQYFFDQSFYSKLVVDGYGNVLQFSNGEMSGNPITILMNSFHATFFYAVHDVIRAFTPIMKYRGEPSVHIALGDDGLTQGVDTYILATTLREMGHDYVEEVGSLLNDVSFLSRKFHYKFGLYRPYYCNLDKMYASLRYTNGGMIEYFQKLTSFVRQLRLAPKKSDEGKWAIMLYNFQRSFYQNNVRKLNRYSANLVEWTELERDLARYQGLKINYQSDMSKVAKRMNRIPGTPKNQETVIKVVRRQADRKPSPLPPSKNTVSNMSRELHHLENKVNQLSKKQQSEHSTFNDPLVRKFATAFITQMMTGNRPLSIPRMIPAYHQVHNWNPFLTVNLPGDQRYGAVMLMPSFRTPFNELLVDQGDVTIPPTQFKQNFDGKFYSDDSKFICMDTTLRVGEKRYASSSFVGGEFQHFSDSSTVDKMKSGGKYYQFNSTISGGSSSGTAVAFKVTNPDSANMQVVMGILELTEKRTVANGFYSAEFTVSGKGNATSVVDLGSNSKAFPFGFAIVIKIENSNTIGLVPSGLVIEIADATNVTFSGAYHWKSRSIPLIMNDDSTGSIRRGYDVAEFHTVTATSLLMRNSTNMFFKEGNLVIARMNAQSLSELPSSPELLFNFLSSRPAYRKKNHSLADGGYDFIIPQKLEDLQWQEQETEANEFLYGDINKPFIVFCWQLPANPGNETRLSLSFQLGFCIEYITDDQATPFRPPLADPSGLMAVYIALAIALTRPTHNPDHWTAISKNIKRMMGNPAFQSAVTSFAKMAGNVALTSALALI